MSLLYFKINQKAVQKYLEERIAFSPKVQEKANSIVANLFGRATKSLMKNFLEHPVTLELKAGSEASNLSNTLNGEGNLFGFLGFWQGQEPTKELEELLEKIDYKQSSIRKNVINYKIVNFPSKQDISEATEINWGNGTSWAWAIENGDFNGDAALSHYIFRSGIGRSEAGIQTKGYEYSEEQFHPIPYMTEILQQFRERVNNSNSKFLI